jgi:hypothetical protein
MTTQKECPICMVFIDNNKNSIITECGHCFHSNCLMTNIADNGFACPYCRTSMYTVSEKKDVNIIVDNSVTTTTYEEDTEQEDIMQDEYEYALRGLRFFFNNLNGDEHNEKDIQDEDDNVKNVVESVKPSYELITQELIKKGVTMEYLIKALLSFQPEYEYENACCYAYDEIYRKVRGFVCSYIPPEDAVYPQIELS